jgi:hypothetical protein
VLARACGIGDGKCRSGLFVIDCICSGHPLFTLSSGPGWNQRR